MCFFCLDLGSSGVFLCRSHQVLLSGKVGLRDGRVRFMILFLECGKGSAFDVLCSVWWWNLVWR